MGFIKKHYEKILLVAVLLGLTVAVVLLPMKISREQATLRELTEQKIGQRPKPLPPLEMTNFTAAYERVEKPAPVVLSGPHNLFNPVQWQKRPDGTLIKLVTGGEVGPSAVGVIAMRPLFTTVAFESVGATGSNYLVSVTRDAETSPLKRRKRSFFAEVGEKGELVTLMEVKGAPEKPELVLLLNDSGDKISVSVDRPYQRADGYTADLKYDPEKKSWLARRVGDKLQFYGDEFTVAAIKLVAPNQFEVVLSARSTGKKTTIRHNAAM